MSDDLHPAATRLQCVSDAIERAAVLVDLLARRTAPTDPMYLRLRYLHDALADAFDVLDDYGHEA